MQKAHPKIVNGTYLVRVTTPKRKAKYISLELN